MAGEKLYPPTISESIPAFCTDGMGRTILSIPFSMNQAVGIDEITGFFLKIKTVQNNILLKTLTFKPVAQQGDFESAIKKIVETGIVEFTDTNELLNEIKIGQFLKVQLAYMSTSGDSDIVGYYSNVGIIKYTANPVIEIEGLDPVVDFDDYKVNPFPSEVIGTYTSTDKTEKPYFYKFSLYDKEDNLLETSNWLLYNNNNKIEDGKAQNSYSIKTLPQSEKIYKLQYSIKTINNLEINSDFYECVEYNTEANPEFDFNLKVDNIFEEGYIKVSFDEKGYYENVIKKITASSTAADVNDMKKFFPYKDFLQTIGKDDIDFSNVSPEKQPSGFIIYTKNEYSIKITPLSSNNPNFITQYSLLQTKTNENNEPQTQLVDQEPVPISANFFSFEICRSDETDNFSNWKVVERKTCNTYKELLDWNFKDFTVQQGIKYKYAFRQYNSQNYYSKRIESEEILSDFEDMFLSDGEKQLKIRFNPKVTSFKTNRLESKFDTIGNKYPFIFKNSIVEYKEFPISGLISYHLDDNEMFIKDIYEELGIILSDKLERQGTPTLNPADFNYNTETLDLINYNIKAERLFKIKVEEWLGDGKVKLFRTPAEGNFFIRLLNISLSPEDKVNRMLHSFSCTAYEVEEFNYENLIARGYYQVKNNNISAFDMGNKFSIEKKIFCGDVENHTDHEPANSSNSETTHYHQDKNYYIIQKIDDIWKLQVKDNLSYTIFKNSDIYIETKKLFSFIYANLDNNNETIDENTKYYFNNNFNDENVVPIKKGENYRIIFNTNNINPAYPDEQRTLHLYESRYTLGNPHFYYLSTNNTWEKDLYVHDRTDPLFRYRWDYNKENFVSVNKNALDFYTEGVTNNQCEDGKRDLGIGVFLSCYVKIEEQGD